MEDVAPAQRRYGALRSGEHDPQQPAGDIPSRGQPCRRDELRALHCHCHADDGLRRARGDHPDVIVLDLQMPNVDGFTVLQELLADARTNSIPVIVSTSLTVNRDLKARLPSGAKLISKDLISRESVLGFLRDATNPAAHP